MSSGGQLCIRRPRRTLPFSVSQSDEDMCVVAGFL